MIERYKAKDANQVGPGIEMVTVNERELAALELRTGYLEKVVKAVDEIIRGQRLEHVSLEDLDRIRDLLDELDCL